MGCSDGYVIVHIPDLLLMPFGDFKFGMGLWNYKMITILLESIIFLAAFIFMQKARKPSYGRS
jgi:hypothetical protein